MEELQVCREERDILKQKLHIHLDRWTLDKIMFEDMTAKVDRLDAPIYSLWMEVCGCQC